MLHLEVCWEAQFAVKTVRLACWCCKRRAGCAWDLHEQKWNVRQAMLCSAWEMEADAAHRRRNSNPHTDGCTMTGWQRAKNHL